MAVEAKVVTSHVDTNPVQTIATTTAASPPAGAADTEKSSHVVGVKPAPSVVDTAAALPATVDSESELEWVRRYGDGIKRTERRQLRKVSGRLGLSLVQNTTAANGGVHILSHTPPQKGTNKIPPNSKFLLINGVDVTTALHLDVTKMLMASTIVFNVVIEVILSESERKKAKNSNKRGSPKRAKAK
jgi:hypothetical protein